MSRRAACALAMIVLAAPARGDTPIDKPYAIEVDRVDTPAGRTELGFDGGAPVPAWGVTLATGWIEEPIAYGDLEPVRRRQTLSIGGAIAIGTIAVDARIGAAHQVGDRLGTLPLDRWVSTDLRLGVRARVVGGDARAVFVRADVTLPTGDDGDFAGEASWALAWRLIARATLPANVVVAASAGIRLRGKEVVVGDRLVGDEVLFAAGVVVPLPPVRPLWCVADAVKLTGELVGIVGDDVGVGEGPSPVEARVGLVTRPHANVTIGARIGAGVNDEIGAPRYRGTLEVTYHR